MLHDLESGKPLEIECMTGAVLEIAGRVGVAVPHTAALDGLIRLRTLLRDRADAAAPVGMSGLLSLPARELLARYASGDASPVEAVREVGERAAALEHLGAFTTLCLERAHEEALASEAAYRRGEPQGPLAGLPLGCKDLYDAGGVRTTYGSTMFRDHVPAADAEALRRARAAGAILVGKTQTHEFAWGISSVNEGMGTSRNPWAPDRISGGSSGGSAVALATHQVSLALGSDTGGSIRVPSALCGTVGFKPTYGRVSLAGIWPLARTLDHPGPMTRTPADAALLLGVIAGPDPADPATLDVPLGDLDAALATGLDGVVVGLCPDLHLVALAPAVQRAFDAVLAAVRASGAEVREVRLPEAPEILPTFGVTQRAEALHVHREAGLYPARADEYGADVRGRLELASTEDVADYLRAAARRERVRAAFRRAVRGGRRAADTGRRDHRLADRDRSRRAPGRGPGHPRPADALHHPAGPGRPAGMRVPGGLRRARAADRRAADGRPVGRRAGARRRARRVRGDVRGAGALARGLGLREPRRRRARCCGRGAIAAP